MYILGNGEDAHLLLMHISLLSCLKLTACEARFKWISDLTLALICHQDNLSLFYGTVCRLSFSGFWQRGFREAWPLGRWVHVINDGCRGKETQLVTHRWWTQNRKTRGWDQSFCFCQFLLSVWFMKAVSVYVSDTSIEMKIYWDFRKRKPQISCSICHTEK